MQPFESISRVALVVLLNGLWQGAAISLVTWLALRLSPRANASTRYAAWTVALVAIAIVPLLTSVTRISNEPQQRAATAVSTPRSQRAIEPSSARTPVRAFSMPHVPAVRVAPPAIVPTLVIALWALGALALVVRLGVALVALERLKRDALPLAMEYRERLERWRAVTQRDRDVRICVTSGIEVPVAVGLFDAMVLLPKHLLGALDIEELDQISLHELAHLLRHDDWTNGFQRLATAMLFFNPFVWIVARQMDIEREVACDDYVLELTGAVRSYAYCLTKMAEMTAWPHQPLAAPGVFITRKNISIRIERLLHAGRAISSSISPAAAAAVLVGLAAAFAIARAATPVVAFTLPQASPLPLAVASIAPVPTARPSKTPAPSRMKTKRIDIPATHIAVNVPSVHVAVNVPSIHIPPIPALPRSVERVAENSPRGNCAGCDFSRANLAGKDFRGQNLTGSDFNEANLRGARFDGSNLSGTTFAGADLRDASFRNANLTGCDLENADLAGARFDGAQLAGCSIDARHLAPSQARIFLANCTGCSFAGADLRGLDLRGIQLTGIDLSGADLRNTDLSRAYMKGVDLSKADLRGARLDGTTFAGCDFDRTDLRSVDLSHVDFIGVSLRNAILTP